MEKTMLFPRRPNTTAAICLLFLVPALHPLLLPLVGVPSHLLWFVHVLPVAWSTYHRGRMGSMISIAVSLLLLVVGERLFGAGYFVAADWQTVISLSVALVFTNALVAGFAGYARRARSLQEQLWHSQKMETIGLFAASVAHDFNNMLTAITLSTEMTLEDMAEDDPRRPQLIEIERAAQRAAILSQRLLTFSRREIAQAAELDVAAAVLDLKEMLRRLVPPRVELRVAVEEVPPVLSDRGHVDQILLNLVVNAADAIPGKGTIAVAVRGARPDEILDHKPRLGGYVLIEVRDSGVGMDAALQRKIFEPLFTTKPPGKGTGLGLSTVKELVAAWDGSISVVSAPEQGSTFRVLLPAYRPASAPAGDSAGGEPDLRLVS